MFLSGLQQISIEMCIEWNRCRPVVSLKVYFCEVPFFWWTDTSPILQCRGLTV